MYFSQKSKQERLVEKLSAIQQQAVDMIQFLPDDRVRILIDVMQGFLKPIAGEETSQTQSRIGTAKGKFVVPDDIDECNDQIAEMFGVAE